MELGRHRTKHDAVNQALALYVRRLEQEKIISLFGTIDYDPKYNQKKQRRRV